jgi:hypothetical protein
MSQFSPAFLQMMMGTQQNQQSKLDADMKAMAIAAQSQSSKEATDARVALGKLDNETRLVDIAATKEARENELAALTMAKDKQELGINDRHAAEMALSEKNAAQAKKKHQFDAQMQALNSAVMTSGNNAMGNIASSNFHYLNSNGPSTFDSFEDQDAIDDWDDRFGKWSTEKREENGAHVAELAVRNQALKGEKADIIRGLSTVIANSEQRILGLNNMQKSFHEISSQVQLDFIDNPSMLLGAMTTPDKTEKGFWARAGSALEQIIPGIGAAFGVGGKVTMGPGQTYMNLPLADKVFGAGGKMKGYQMGKGPLGYFDPTGDDSAQEVADLVYNKDTGTRAMAGKEVASILSGWGVSTEGIEGMKDQISWEETTLYSQGVNREEYIEAIALKVAHQNGRAYEKGEQEKVETVDRMASNSSMNPLFDRETLSIMGAEHFGDTKMTENERNRQGVISYSANPKNSLLGMWDFGADAIRAKANDGFTSADRYLRMYTREMAGGGQFGNIGETLESANNAIMNFLNTPRGERDAERLGATLKELSLGNNGQNFILMDSFFDTLAGMSKPNFDETLNKKLHDAGLKQDSELFTGVQKGWREMVNTLRKVGKTWNGQNGAGGFGGTQDIHFVKGYQKRMTEELFKEEGKKIYGNINDIDTGNPLVIQHISDKVSLSLWEALPPDLPQYVKEALFRKEMERLYGITDEYSRAAASTTKAAESYREWMEASAREEEGFEDERATIRKGGQRKRAKRKSEGTQEILDRFLEEE